MSNVQTTPKIHNTNIISHVLVVSNIVKVKMGVGVTTNVGYLFIAAYYRSADKSLARTGRKQANASVIMG